MGTDSWKDHLRRAVDLFGSQEKLAKAMGTNQSRINWLLTKAVQIPAEDALNCHRATQGEVSGDQLRPDLWHKPEHVPGARPAEQVVS